MRNVRRNIIKFTANALNFLKALLITQSLKNYLVKSLRIFLHCFKNITPQQKILYFEISHFTRAPTEAGVTYRRTAFYRQSYMFARGAEHVLHYWSSKAKSS